MDSIFQWHDVKYSVFKFLLQRCNPIIANPNSKVNRCDRHTLFTTISHLFWHILYFFRCNIYFWKFAVQTAWLRWFLFFYCKIQHLKKVPTNKNWQKLFFWCNSSELTIDSRCDTMNKTTAKGELLWQLFQRILTGIPYT